MYAKIYRHLLIILLLALPVLTFAQKHTDRSKIVNKTWHIIAMKCPEQYVDSNNADQYIHYYSTIKLAPVVYNNVDYGTYTRIYRDSRDNPREFGKYSLVTDVDGSTRMILKSGSGTTTEYRVEVVSDHYLTLYNLGDVDKCRVSYAVAP